VTTSMTVLFDGVGVVPPVRTSGQRVLRPGLPVSSGQRVLRAGLPVSTVAQWEAQQRWGGDPDAA
jgi:hypothetical protein